MRFGPFILLGVSAAVACSLAACHPKPLSQAFRQGSDGRPMRAVASLDCPDKVNDLRRTSKGADGHSCSYDGPDAERIALTLAPLGAGGAQAQLDALDAQLKTELPGAAQDPSSGQGVYVSSDGGRDQAHIDLPGFHLNATGGKASIRMPGVAIDANGKDAHVSTGAFRSAVVNAHEGGAEVRTGGSGPNGTATTYLLASDTPGPGGERAVGYIAKGPTGGPLVVATFRASGSQKGDQLGTPGLERLVDMNVHG